MFAGEAYNVEMGVTNELFPDERSLPPPHPASFNPTPEDTTNFPASGATILSDTVAFSNFMRFPAPPAPSTQRIQAILRLNPSPTARVYSPKSTATCVTRPPCKRPPPPSQRGPQQAERASLFGNLLVHHMGSGLADNISQGSAGPDEFRTAPLWGLGQRLFFLHDGRAMPSNGGLLTAIQAHASTGSEAK